MAIKYILAIDQGTTSTRALLFNKAGVIVYKSQQELTCYYPNDGWVEQNALDVWLSVLDVINDCLAKTNLSYDDIDCIGLTNQRETTVVWDKKTGMPVYNAIVWQSRQSQKICDKWSKYTDLIHQKTGLILNPYFSASKIRFILDTLKDGQERAEKGELMCGTIDTWIMYKLSNGKIFKTDVTNASRTMLFNITTLEWDEELLKLFNIPKCMLSEVAPSSNYFGEAIALRKKLKICGVAGDQQAALFGQNCFEPGDLKNTYGTGCFMLMNTGNKPIFSKNGLVTTIAWKIGDDVVYALEGSVFIGGAVVQWLRDSMRMIKEASDTEQYAKDAKTDLGVYVVPAFVGLGAPYWDNDVRGAVFGLTRATSKEHFIRAVLNSIALQSKDLEVAMEKECHNKVKVLKVDGGATSNGYLMQYQADILNSEVLLPVCLETTALGVAYLAGLQNKYWKSIDEIKKIHKYQKEYTPKMKKAVRDEIDYKWHKAIEAVRVFK
jgi:glycerol kinase